MSGVKKQKKQQTAFSVASIIAQKQINSPEGFFSPGRVPRALSNFNKENKENENGLDYAESPKRKPDFADSPKRKQEEAFVVEATTKRSKNEPAETDQMKFQEELQEEREKVKALQETNAELRQKLNEYEKERAELIVGRDKLKAELREQLQARETLETELASRERRSVALELERNWTRTQLAESSDKLQGAEEEIKRAQAQNQEQAMRIQSLSATVEESLFELRSKEQQLSQMNDLIREKEAQLEGQAAKSKKEADKLEKKLVKDAETHKSSMQEMESQIDHLRLKYFVSVVLAIKLNLSTCGVSYKNDINAQALFDEAMTAGVAPQEWPKWIFKRLNKQ